MLDLLSGHVIMPDARNLTIALLTVVVLRVLLLSAAYAAALAPCGTMHETVAST